MTENIFFRNEHPILGVTREKGREPNRSRTWSEPQYLSREKQETRGRTITSRRRGRAQSEPEVDVDPEQSPSSDGKGRKKLASILDQIIRQSDYEGRGMSTVATTELSLLLWMMLEAGHGWTAMALHLLAKHPDACIQVQAELDELETHYGKDRLFTHFVLQKMEKLDNLIFEAVRLCPDFMGGMKKLSQTVELDGVQIPKNTNIILCNVEAEESFTLGYSPCRRPQMLGTMYPSVEL